MLSKATLKKVKLGAHIVYIKFIWTDKCEKLTFQS